MTNTINAGNQYYQDPTPLFYINAANGTVGICDAEMSLGSANWAAFLIPCASGGVYRGTTY